MRGSLRWILRGSSAPQASDPHEARERNKVGALTFGVSPQGQAPTMRRAPNSLEKKTSPPLPSILFSPLAPRLFLFKKGWMRLGAGAVVSQRTTISYLLTASKATSESALLRLPPATANSVRWFQSVTWWPKIKRSPCCHLSNWSVSHSRWIWSYLQQVVTFSCKRREFACDLTGALESSDTGMSRIDPENPVVQA